MYYSRNESEPLIDMICRVDGGFDAIQSTISPTHKAQAKKIRELKADLGLDDNSTLRIFYAVPLCRYAGFLTDPVNPLLSEQDLDNVRIYHIGVSGDDEE